MTVSTLYVHRHKTLGLHLLEQVLQSWRQSGVELASWLGGSCAWSLFLTRYARLVEDLISISNTVARNTALTSESIPNTLHSIPQKIPQAIVAKTTNSHFRRPEGSSTLTWGVW